MSIMQIYAILLQVFLYNSYIIKLPFKTKKNDINKNEEDLYKIFTSLLDNNIYVNLNMGTPSQEIETFIKMRQVSFFFSNNSKEDYRTNNIKYDIRDVNSPLNKFYDISKSSSFIKVSNKTKKDYSNHEGVIGKESFKFNNNMINELSFILSNTTSGNMPGCIGLKLVKGKEQNEYNFISQLKMNNIIENYYWTLNYTSENEGYIIIGEQPHIYDKNNFNIIQLKEAYTFIIYTITDWGLIFSDIIFLNGDFQPFLRALFIPEINYILGIDLYKESVMKYLNNSFNNKICFFINLKNRLYAPNQFIYCDKNLFKNDLINFPTLFLPHDELNYTFGLNYNDLWMEFGNKLIFLVFLVVIAIIIGNFANHF